MSHFTLHTALSTTPQCDAETYCEWSSWYILFLHNFYPWSFPKHFILSTVIAATEGPCGQLPFPYANQRKEICPQGKKLDSCGVVFCFFLSISIWWRQLSVLHCLDDLKAWNCILCQERTILLLLSIAHGSITKIIHLLSNLIPYMPLWSGIWIFTTGPWEPIQETHIW